MDDANPTGATERTRRRRAPYWVVPLLVLLVGALVVGTALLAGVAARSPADSATPAATPSAPPSPAYPAPPGWVDDGFEIDPLGERPVRLALYVDYRCADCAAFDGALGEVVEEWIEEGSASLSVHPVSWPESPEPEASTLTAAAAACVGALAPGAFYAFHTGLLEEAAAPVDADSLVALAADRAGATDPAVGACIRDGRWLGWVADATARAVSEPLTGSGAPLAAVPTVLVGGERYPGAVTDAAAFARFVGSQR